MTQETPADDLLQRFEELNAVGVALSRERDIVRLLETILLAAMRITHADGGTLYRVSDDGRSLRFEIMRTESLGIALGGTTGKEITLPPVKLYDDEGRPNERAISAWAAIHESTVNIADAYDVTHFDFSGTRAFDAKTGYRSQSFLTVPMKNHEDRLIGVLQLLNAKDSVGGKVTAFSKTNERMVESLASQAAIALTNRLLISQLEDLFESFIGLINTAIDEKSPYTGGHCARVPELTLMLADAANAVDQGPLAEFKMTERDRYELKIAGLLHDCGKVTTPVHVVDKATKLQTIYDRIGLVDTRFEVLKRDAEIAALRDQLAQWRAMGSKLSETERQEIERAESERNAALQQALKALDEDRAFLRRSNTGGEFMNPADQQRVRDISTGHRWRNPNGEESDFLSDDEIENLTIPKGTLTEKERQIINHHIVATIRMLEQLPWPHHLTNVTEYAGGHHERMDGKGYPKGLTREQMSWQARMMGIADVFEALTAADRPYKPGMKLSQALSIMARMKREGHIDPDLFDVFVGQKVYQDYANRFLDEKQIDAVDESALI